MSKMSGVFSRICSLAALATLMLLVWPGQSFAQSHPEFIPGRVSMVLYKPDSGPAPHIAFLIAHRTGNNLGNVACRELAKRGFAAICFNTRYVNNEMAVQWENIALDVKAAVDYAHTVPGIDKVVLYGHSGGTPLMTYYQAIAESGVSFCQGPGKLVQCGNNLAGLKPADGLLIDEGHAGDGFQSLTGINPSLAMVDGKPKLVDPSLNPFDPKNGYNPDGPSHYSQDFRTRYYAAQSKVMNAQIAQVQALQERIKNGAGPYPDNDIVLVPFSAERGAARLSELDPSVPEYMSTAKPRKFLKNDGTIVTEIVHSIEPPHPERAKSNLSFEIATKVLTIKSYLSTNAIKSTNSFDGVDWCSVNNSSMCSIQYIKAPTLIVAMGAYHLLADEERIFEKSAAADKDYIVIEGGTLGYTGCKDCGVPAEKFSNAEKNNFDYVAKWANAKF
jgi:hypothetical protein